MAILTLAFMSCTLITLDSSCSGTSANKRYVGYFESWSSLRSCDAFKPSDINVEPWTVSKDRNSYYYTQGDTSC